MPSLLSERYTVPKLLYLSTKKYHRICLFQDSSFIQSSYFLPSALPAMYSPLPLRLRDSVWSEIEVWRSDDVGLTLKEACHNCQMLLSSPIEISGSIWNIHSWKEGHLYAVLEERKCVAETVLLFPSSLCHQFGNKNNFKAWGPTDTQSVWMKRVGDHYNTNM